MTEPILSRRGCRPTDEHDIFLSNCAYRLLPLLSCEFECLEDRLPLRDQPVETILPIGGLLAANVLIARSHVRDGRDFHSKQQRLAGRKHHQTCLRLLQQCSETVRQHGISPGHGFVSVGLHAMEQQCAGCRVDGHHEMDDVEALHCEEKRLLDETREAWLQRRDQLRAALIKDNDPLVYAQEYLAEFVDWAGVGFFAREKLLDQGKPVPYPASCDGVFAIIDTASKTGTEHDGTAVTFFARDKHLGFPLLVLDWDIVQIEGALLETWLPSVFKRLEELSRLCHARRGSVGACIEDKDSGTILLQQARRRNLPVRVIDSRLTALGKDERALSVSGYVHRGEVKYTDCAFNKTVTYKQKSRNHLLDQIESFRMGDKDPKREDDLLDTFCYGISLALGNSEGF
jgi:hypothetical protein